MDNNLQINQNAEQTYHSIRQLSQLKIDSEVATDNDKEEFLEILRTGIVNKEMKSKYACNFRFFQNNIDEFLSKKAAV